MELLRDKRLIIAGLVLCTIAILFWSGSRYPSLDEKAGMAGEVELGDPLGFEVWLEIPEDAGTVERIVKTALNWVSTNRNGMTFGLLFAAAFLTMLPLFKRRSFQGRFSNTLLGMAIGTPLGVCVNCAAPIAQGMHSGGTRTETTLAAMISSPTLNLVVLTMAFSLFPVYMFALKLGATLLFLLVAIPLLGWFASRWGLIAAAGTFNNPNDAHCQVDSLPPVATGWWSSVKWFVREYPIALWRVVRLTLPWMLAAGVLGAAAITLLPWNQLIETVSNLSGLEALLAVLGIALFGLFLPVPIAFDVFICSALLAAGMPVREVMVLLFTLGVFSVYSFTIVGRALSWRLAGLMALLLVVFGMGTGYLAGELRAIQATHAERDFRHLFQASDAPQGQLSQGSKGEPEDSIVSWMQAQDDIDVNVAPLPERLKGIAQARLVSELAPEAKGFYSVMPSTASLKIERQPLSSAGLAGSAESSSQRFEKVEGTQLGLHEAPFPTLAHQFTWPLSWGRGIAAGDVHGDGWEDLLVGSPSGVYLYANRAGRYFDLQEIELPTELHDQVFAIGMADWNNDGWLDLYFSVFNKGNYLYLNNQGQFIEAGLTRLPDNDSVHAQAAAFGDLDRDGQLELMLGNYSHGVPALFTESSRNHLVRQLGDGFTTEPLPGVPGETNTNLISDLNGDGYPDYFVGNDFDEPDSFYFGSPDGLKLLKRGNGLISRTGVFPMSLDTADIDNDLDLELYEAQATGGLFEDNRRLAQREPQEICGDIADTERRARCQADMALHADISVSSWLAAHDELLRCQDVEEAAVRADCHAIVYFRWITRAGMRRFADPALRANHAEHCQRIPDRWAHLRELCASLEAPWKSSLDLSQTFREQIKGMTQRNLLFVEENGRYKNMAKQMGLDVMGWSWSTKFADLDNDGWQDIYSVNGLFDSRRRESNEFFRNIEGKVFERQTKESGLEDYFTAGAYTYVDFDADGDLDIITLPFSAPPHVYRNQTQGANALMVELRDMLGNRFAIGSKVIVHYGPEGKLHQMRELKAGGGFQSMDPPLLHFGLADHTQVQRIEILWSTGGRDMLQGPFETGYRYRIQRSESQVAVQ